MNTKEPQLQDTVETLVNAIKAFDHRNVVNTLARDTTLVRATTKDDNTPLHVACSLACEPDTLEHAVKLKIIGLLVMFGANVQEENQNKELPVDIAVLMDDYEVVEYLTDQKRLSCTHGAFITGEYLQRVKTTARNAHKKHLEVHLDKELRKAKEMSRQKLLEKTHQGSTVHDIHIESRVQARRNTLRLEERDSVPMRMLSAPSALIQQPVSVVERKVPKITNLVFQGGGVLGIAYCGVLKELIKQGVQLTNIKRLGGTSAGALFAGLMAVGLDEAKIQAILTPSFAQYLDEADGAKETFMKLINNSMNDSKSFLTKLDMMYEVASLFFGRIESNLGIFEGETFLNKYRGYIKDATGRDKLTFRQLHDEFVVKNSEKYKDLYVVSVDIQTGESKIFSHETTPDAEVALCCRMSMSVPLVFQPVEFKFPGNADPHLFVDGGEGMNFPITIFDKEKYVGLDPQSEKTYFNSETLGIRLVDNSIIKHYLRGTSIPAKPMPSKDLKGFVTFMLYLVTQDKNVQENLISYADPQNDRTVFVDSSGVNFINFNLSDGEKMLLMMAGEKGVESYFERMLLKQLRDQLKEIEEKDKKDPESQGTDVPDSPDDKLKKVESIADIALQNWKKKSEEAADLASDLTKKVGELEKKNKTQQEQLEQLQGWKTKGIIAIISSIIIFIAFGLAMRN